MKQQQGGNGVVAVAMLSLVAMVLFLLLQPVFQGRATDIVAAEGESQEDMVVSTAIPTSDVSLQTEEVQAVSAEVNPMRGVWISFLEFQWMLTGKTEEEFQQAVAQVYTTCQEKGLNTVVVQVRSHGDAYYPSDYYPWSAYASGTIGVSPGFDPLAVMVTLAESYDLSIHAWINPYRLSTEEHMQATSQEYLTAQWYQAGINMKKQDNYYYLDPGKEEVTTLICDGVEELLTTYKLDGIQIDDYFYVADPTVFGHTPEQAKEYTSHLVQSLYTTVKSVDPQLQFGISPSGNFGEVPKSDEEQHTDLVRWCAEGWMDYLAPQIYWDYNDPIAPFLPILQKWEGLVADTDIALYVGLAPYKYDWAVIESQIAVIQESVVAEGYLLFRYDYILP